MAGQLGAEYNIYDTGVNKNLVRDQTPGLEINDLQVQDPAVSNSSSSGSSVSSSFDGGLFNPVQGTTPTQAIRSGELSSLVGQGKQKFTDTTAGFLMGVDTDNIYKWIIGDANSSADWAVTTAATLTIKGNITTDTGLIGGFTIGADYIRDAANSFGLASTVTGSDDVRFWAGATFANRSTAPARITEAGVATFTSGAVGGWTLGSSTLTGGNVVLSNTGVITVGTSNDVAIISSADSTYRQWIGNATAASAPFSVTKTGVVVASNITATGTINATGGYIGSTTALVYESQGINTGVTGHIRGGQTDYETGTGYFLGYSSSAYKFSIGIGGQASDNLHWDGTNLYVNGTQLRNQDIFGDGSDGDVTISADTSLSSDMFYNNLTINTTKTLNPNGFRIFVKGTLTINGTGKIARNGNAGGNGGDATGTTSGAGTAGAAGAALADGSIKGSLAGEVGKIGVIGVTYIGSPGGSTAGNVGTNGKNGTNTAKSLVATDGADGQAGGNSGSVTDASFGSRAAATGGTPGTGGVRTGTVYNLIHNAIAAYRLYDDNGSAFLTSAPSSGGAASGASAPVTTAGSNDVASGATGGSGGGGSQGGIVVIFARFIINAGSITANGGVGGNAGATFASNVAGARCAAGGSGGSSGGSGGNGGILILVYSSLTNSGTIQASGGVGGNGAAAGTKAQTGGGATSTVGVDGTTGTTGNSGVVIQLQL